MTMQDTDRGIQPTDRAEAISPATAVPDEDTEGHSLLTVELDRSNRSDRARETDKIVRDNARAKETHSSSEGGFLKRFRRG